MRSARAAWAVPPAPPARRTGPARAAPTATAPVLDTRGSGAAAGPALAPADGGAAGQLASASGRRTRGSTTWQRSWQQYQQRQPHQTQQQEQPQQQRQLTWVLQGAAGLVLADPLDVFQKDSWTAIAADAECPPTPSTAASTGLNVQVNDPPPRPPPAQQQGEGGSSGGSGGRDPDQQEFFANVGDAIRSLREDYPLLFVKDLNYSIYREDLTFNDPNLTFHGLRTYRAIFWGLRLHGRLLLRAANVRVLRIWQPEDTVIKLRWQINATVRLSGTNGTFDGISVYKLDRRGRVYQHEVTDVQLRDPPITNPLLYGLNFILSPRPQVQQVPCPGGYFVDGEEDGEALVTAPALLSVGSADRAGVQLHA